MPLAPTPTRRDILAAGVAVLASGAIASARTPAPPRPRAAKARNVILLVADGMSIGAFTLADLAIRRRNGRGSAWAELWDRPDARRSLMSTQSADSIVTDSAAAGSAWGSGQRIHNGAINAMDGRDFEPILVAAKHAGKATGLVTTTRLTHATPASFIANVPNRGMEPEIARQILDRSVDVALAGGAKYLTPELLAEYPGLVVARTADQLRAATHQPGRLFGLFHDDHMSYERDRPDTEPHLREMSMIAIERLARHPEGFVLQIEGGRVDHAAHANDIVGTLFDQIAFDETVGAVAEWAAERDDTLVIITTDHGTGGPELSAYTRKGLAGFDTLLNARRSLSWIVDRAREENGDPLPALRRLIEEHVSVRLTDAESDWIARAAAGERTNAFDGANAPVAALGAVMGNHFAVGWVSIHHTAEHVEATAFGPGAELLPPRIENFQLHGIMHAALALPVS
jgi:alkaline phosphatase